MTWFLSFFFFLWTQSEAEKLQKEDTPELIHGDVDPGINQAYPLRGPGHRPGG